MSDPFTDPDINPNPSNLRTPTDPFPELTGRERDVAIRLMLGDTNREIADVLGISIKTVDTHRGHVLKKLGLKNNAKLALYAVKRGYVVP